MTFEGFPMAAVDFYEDLEMNNTKAWWDEHKNVYRSAVVRPMRELTDALADEFGEAKVFRPNRDLRFSHDKSPYKTHQGAYVSTAAGCGWYVQISADGLRTGGGFYRADGAALARLRARIDSDAGAELARLVVDLTADGWVLGGDTLTTAPRGFDRNHPRIDLLRHKSLSVGRRVDDEAMVSAAALEHVRADWNAVRPLVDWLTETLR
ncbi:DUF2461 domain-containing protein [Kribbia dieselivorans]|uniref:DUF2461 domain-containing protein n=1 Tax=Kribbia dieselivorans TaxID=331526 RepID=UPI0008385DDD|nr:DUF2461 domain-containing protein [Kribbia dieselivorans]